MEKDHIKMIEDIHAALVGNQYNDKGIIKRFEITESKVYKHELVLKIISGVIVLLVGIAAFFKDILDIFN